MAGQLHQLDRTTISYAIGTEVPPRLHVMPGAEVLVETHDARSGRLRRPDDIHATMPDFTARVPATNPVTGPIWVEGAAPGDALVVDVISISLDPQGFLMVQPTSGLVPGLVERPTARICQVQDGMVRFGEWHFPTRPMIGVMGCAPAGEAIATLHPGPHGGNMDNNRITTGSRIRLPVRVPGAYFFVGDLHASMGDGEVSGTGIEIGGRVHLRLSLEKGAARAWPWIETADRWVTTASAPDFEQAAEIAVREMMGLLGDRLGFSPADAFLFISATGDVRANQVCRMPIDASVRCEVPKPGAGMARG